MKIVAHDNRGTTVQLTRRNLETLLAKLDEPKSTRTLIKYDEELDRPPFVVYVQAVENEEHYKDRAPGPMLVNGVMV